MNEKVEFGENKTGLKHAPELAIEMLRDMEKYKIPPSDGRLTPASLKKQYIEEAGDVGDVPIVEGGQTDKQPAILIDKLGQRLAYERSGVRLYDAFIAKCAAVLPAESLSLLRQFRDEELEHFKLLQETLEKLGADPTAQTPCADVSGVAGMGLIQVINDPRTNLSQCAEALLIAELTDNDAWDVLIKLVDEAGLTEEKKSFENAKANEEKHLQNIRQLLTDLIFENKQTVLI